MLKVQQWKFLLNLPLDIMIKERGQCGIGRSDGDDLKKRERNRKKMLKKMESPVLDDNQYYQSHCIAEL